MVRTPQTAIVSRPQQLESIKAGKYVATGYRSAKIATRESRTYSSGAGEMHNQVDRLSLVNQSREFMRDNSIYKGMIERAVSYIIGNGFNLQAKTNSTSWNDKAETLFWDYWQNPEIKGLSSGNRIERLIARELLVAGDVGVIKTNKGVIQLVESEQIAGSKYSEDGVVRDSFGKPTMFKVCGYTSNGSLERAKPKEYKPKDFIFISDPERPSSVRSVPPCQSSFPMIHRINDICDSEAIAWQMIARLALSITRENAGELAQAGSIEDTAGGDTRIQELDYALIFHGAPGDEIKGVERNMPSQNFSETLTMFLRLLGLPLGLPIEIIMLDWTKSNYSQSRAVLEQAYQMFVGWQGMIESLFHRAIYKWKVDYFISQGQLSDRKDKYEHEWIKPTFPWIDQLKEAEASSLKVERGFTTHSQICKSQYQEREDIVKTRETEIRDAIARAQKIKTDTSVEVDWRLFAGLKPLDTAVPIKADDNSKDKKDDEALNENE